MASVTRARSPQPDLAAVTAAIMADLTIEAAMAGPVAYGSGLVQATFKRELTPLELAAFNAAVDGAPDYVLNIPEQAQPVKMLNTQPGDFALPVVTRPRRGSATIRVTPNWCNRTTWWQGSVPVTNQTLIWNASGKYFDLGYRDVIDVEHGLVYNDRRLRDVYGVRVYPPGQQQSALTPRSRYDRMWEGDYCVDYDRGHVHVREEFHGADLRADFHYSASSRWALYPDQQGTLMRVTDTEAQFTTDTHMTDAVCFALHGKAAYYAPHKVDPLLMTAIGDPGTPLPPSTVIPVDVFFYDTMRQFDDRAVGSLPMQQPVGGPRGLKHALIIKQFPQAAAYDLSHQLGNQLVIALENDVVFSGEHATATVRTDIESDDPVSALQAVWKELLPLFSPLEPAVQAVYGGLHTVLTPEGLVKYGQFLETTYG